VFALAKFLNAEGANTLLSGLWAKITDALGGKISKNSVKIVNGNSNNNASIGLVNQVSFLTNNAELKMRLLLFLPHYSGDGALVSSDIVMPNASASQTGLLTSEQFGALQSLVAALPAEVVRAQTAEQANAAAVADEAAARADADAQLWLLVPVQASALNQLADKAFVNSTLNSLSAFHVVYDAQNNPFPTKAALLGATTCYYGGQPYTPSNNDYATVLADEAYAGAQTRYVYDGASWAFQFKINDTPFTASQLAAINSGVTAAAISAMQSNILALQQSALSYTAPTSGSLAGMNLTNAIAYLNELCNGVHKNITIDVNTLKVPLS
jgi:hypothetical protein